MIILPGGGHWKIDVVVLNKPWGEYLEKNIPRREWTLEVLSIRIRIRIRPTGDFLLLTGTCNVIFPAIIFPYQWRNMIGSIYIRAVHRILDPRTRWGSHEVCLLGIYSLEYRIINMFRNNGHQPRWLP